MELNHGPLDYETSALTTAPLCFFVFSQTSCNVIFSLLVSEENGFLVMEVGISRSIKFTYRNRSFIEAYREATEGTNGNEQHVSIPMQRWLKLGEIHDHVRQQIREVADGNQVDTKFHIGGSMFVTISSRYRNIQIRQYAAPARGSKMFPTRSGISMSIQEYCYFIKLAQQFTEQIPLARSLVPCYKRRDHSPACLECFPVRQRNSLAYQLLGV